ncbi:hypothetical protein AB0I51_31715 [Streptomyces sp. NPDC050549]|uniref:hypothetical protein n=1 Tax=Streptomyces sp. NPDC050549 TaxID=3155406 RepID=UPI003414A647
MAATGNVRVVPVDLGEASGPARLVEAADDRIDILANNVGSAPARTGGFLTVTDEEWLTTLNLNRRATIPRRAAPSDSPKVSARWPSQPVAGATVPKDAAAICWT